MNHIRSSRSLFFTLSCINYGLQFSNMFDLYHNIHWHLNQIMHFSFNFGQAFKLFNDNKLKCFVIKENFDFLNEMVQPFHLIWHFDCERWHNHQIFLVDFAGLLVVDQVDDGNVRLTCVVPRWRGHGRWRVRRVPVRVQTEKEVEGFY